MENETPPSLRKLLSSMLPVLLDLCKIFALGLVSRIYEAWVITKLWSWFILGFAGLPALPFGVAIGLTILWRYISPGFADNLGFLLLEEFEKRGWLSKENLAGQKYSPLVLSTAVLVVGWVAQGICRYFGLF